MWFWTKDVVHCKSSGLTCLVDTRCACCNSVRYHTCISHANTLKQPRHWLADPCQGGKHLPIGRTADGKELALGPQGSRGRCSQQQSFFKSFQSVNQSVNHRVIESSRVERNPLPSSSTAQSTTKTTRARPPTRNQAIVSLLRCWAKLLTHIRSFQQKWP